MYEIDTHVSPHPGTKASELDLAIRETFGHASESDGSLRIEWDDDLERAHVKGCINTVRSAPELVKLLSMLGGEAEIRRAA